MGGVITEEPFLSVFPQTRNANVQGIIIALLELGALFGSILCMFYGDRFGRRATVFFGMACMVIGGVLQTSAWHIAQLGVGRVISGTPYDDSGW
jgi:MFS family permease